MKGFAGNVFFACLVATVGACAGPQVSLLPDDAIDPVRDAARDCDRGDQLRCLDLAEAYLEGQGVDPNVDAAIPLLREACATGMQTACERAEEVRLPEGASAEAIADARRCDRADQAGCTALGIRYRTGDGVPPDADHASTLINNACERGHSPACSVTEEARMLSSGNAELISLGRACDRADRNACRDLGSALLEGSLGFSSPGDGLRLLEHVCAQRDVVVCARLALLWRDGEMVAVDIDRAVSFASTACAGGFSEACGYLRQTELPGGAPTEVLALAQSCDRGDDEACIDLAVAHAQGDAWGGDARIAARVLDEQCEAGATRACTELAELARSGEGVPRDSARAARLFEIACAAGDSAACVEVGEMLNTGAGVVRNPQAAREFWRIGCEAGNAEACDLLPGWAEASLPMDATDRIRNLARTCDRGTWLSCVELGAELRANPTADVDPGLANDLFVRACINGVSDACGLAAFAQPCETDVLDEDGNVTRTIVEEIDLAAAAAGPDGRVAQGESVTVLPEISRGGEIASLDGRVSLTWETARDATDWPPGVAIESDEAGRTVRATLEDGTLVVLAFDVSGRLLRLAESEVAQGPESLVITLSWDPSGRLEALFEQTETTSVDVRWTWDDGDRLLSESFVRTSASHTETRTRTYVRVEGRLDEQQEQTVIRTSSGREVTNDTRMTRFIHDRAGNLIRIDVRDADRDILSSRVFRYTCWESAALR